jgi:hypothetical protein
VNPAKSFIHGTTDTMEVRFSQDKYRFYVNEQILDSVAGGQLTFEGAGLHVGPGITVSFDQFSVAPGGSPFCAVSYAAAQRHGWIRSDHRALRIAVDPLGRRVPLYLGGTTELLKGVYFLRTPDGQVRPTWGLKEQR